MFGAKFYRGKFWVICYLRTSENANTQCIHKWFNKVDNAYKHIQNTGKWCNKQNYIFDGYKAFEYETETKNYVAIQILSVFRNY